MTVHVDLFTRASREEVERAVLDLYQQATGYRAPGEAAHALLVRIGLANLKNIKEAFLAKARGGADITGLTWPKLSKKTIAYSRRHPGIPKGFYRALYSPSWMLMKKQRERWWKLYRQYGGAGPEGETYHQRGGNNPYAARIAWRILKAEGAKTLLGTYGGVQVEILRSAGLLYNSLSPGVPVSHAGSAPPRVADQVFRLERAAVIVGTNRKHARTHHEGLGHVPQRKLWPDPSTWPPAWWDGILAAAQQGIVDILIEVLKRT